MGTPLIFRWIYDFRMLNLQWLYNAGSENVRRFLLHARLLFLRRTDGHRVANVRSTKPIFYRWLNF